MLDRLKFLIERSGNASDVLNGNSSDLYIGRGHDVIDVLKRFENEKKRPYLKSWKCSTKQEYMVCGYLKG